MSIKRTVKKLIPKGLFSKIEPIGHLVESVILSAMAGFPQKGIKVIGVTGTNGKTSTAFMIHKMLVEAGYNAGIMTTVAYGVGEDVKNQVQHYTNVPVPEFLRRIKEMRKQGVDWLVLESTSQGLAQHRLWGVDYSIAVMTNVTHEHLDYHGTFDNYKEAKRLLFKRAARNKSGLRLGIANADDPSGSEFAATTPNSVLYGMKDGDLRASDVDLRPDGSTFKAKIENDEYLINCNIPGGFYVENALATVAVGRAVGLNKEQIEKGIAALKGIDGRMTTINAGQEFSVIVDYAHTPDSFKKLLSDIRPIVSGKLIVMFGSAGRRDEKKRYVQGELAGKYADVVVLTEEDDRDIDGLEILNQIAEGVEVSGKIRDDNLFLVQDRTEAIQFALGKATSKDDVVLLLGKGHEKTIERADGEHSWDEIAVAEGILRSL